MPELSVQQTAKLVLLGEMGSGKSSLVLRYVKGQFFDYQVSYHAHTEWQRMCVPVKIHFTSHSFYLDAFPMIVSSKGFVLSPAPKHTRGSTRAAPP